MTDQHVEQPPLFPADGQPGPAESVEPIDDVAARIAASAPADPYAAQQARARNIIEIRDADLGAEQKGPSTLLPEQSTEPEAKTALPQSYKDARQKLKTDNLTKPRSVFKDDNWPTPTNGQQN